MKKTILAMLSLIIIGAATATAKTVITVNVQTPPVPGVVVVENNKRPVVRKVVKHHGQHDRRCKKCSNWRKENALHHRHIAPPVHHHAVYHHHVH